MNDAVVQLAQSDAATTMLPVATGTVQIVLLTSAVMFAVGMVGFLTRRNMILMFLCTELMFQASAIAMIAFGRMHLNPEGQVFVIFILTVAAAEAALALGLVVLLYRRKPTLDAEAWSELKEC
ncbi:MAG: NADH-quinone oxidoreductase subunit NuoK [Phycisphaerales bacterium]|nr:NADH-quinone oxidoreductase subunit NuoK [Phycisphaerales bacterium]MDG1978083.1 NADH-quinone oxidoreductase subunit NuoK [Phycisphaerales bacterium]MDG2132320.1 NADH-quinone oxidoreductase subunit NuoK [Phycisphaerales bacterium]